MKPLLILCLLASSVQAQEKFKPFNLSDAAFWAGAGLDAASSVGKLEANPLWRNSKGEFSAGKNLAFKSGLWGAFKVLEYHYSTPHQRRVISWVKIGIGCGYGVIAARNFTR
jgi:hypothetical protein